MHCFQKLSFLSFQITQTSVVATMADVERMVLLTSSHKECPSKKLKEILRGPQRKFPKYHKAILVHSVALATGKTRAKSLLSSNAKPGASVAVISDTIAGMRWTKAVKRWLQEDIFRELSRAVFKSTASRNLLAFTIVLRNSPDETDLLEALYWACHDIVKGRRLVALYLKHFDFKVFSRRELCLMEQVIKHNALFKKIDLRVENDLLAVIHIKSCYPFENVTGWTMPQIAERDQEDEAVEDKEDSDKEDDEENQKDEENEIEEVNDDEADEVQAAVENGG